MPTFTRFIKSVSLGTTTGILTGTFFGYKKDPLVVSTERENPMTSMLYVHALHGGIVGAFLSSSVALFPLCTITCLTFCSVSVIENGYRLRQTQNRSQ